MLQLIVATSRPDELKPLTTALSAHPEVEFQQFLTGSEVLRAVRANAPDLVIIDATLPDMEPLGLVQELLKINAMVNTALVSRLTEAEFHEATEGLGILARLPLTPDRSDAEELLLKLTRVLGKT